MIPISRSPESRSGPAAGPAARTAPPDPPRLPAGSAVGSFVLQKVQARDEFGIRYRATSSASAHEVIIEEYAPAQISQRDETGLLRPRSPAHAALWEEGLQAFLQESEQLARPLHPALVRIGAVWQMRGTAYRLWPALAGRSLGEVVEGLTEAPTEAWLRQLLDPLLDALERLHDAGWVHGNVCPGQIVVRNDGAPMLLDTAAVRATIGARMPQRTVWPEPGFRSPELADPPSQHAPGPWSDVYALAAVAQFCMSAPAAGRGGADGAGRYPSRFVSVFERALAPDPRERPASIADLRRLLQAPGAEPVPPVVPTERRGLALSDIPVLSQPFQEREPGWPARAGGDDHDVDRRRGGGLRADELIFHGAMRPPRRPLPRARRRWPLVAGGLLCVALFSVAVYQWRTGRDLLPGGALAGLSTSRSDPAVIDEPSAAGRTQAPPELGDAGVRPPIVPAAPIDAAPVQPAARATTPPVAVAPQAAPAAQAQAPAQRAAPVAPVTPPSRSPAGGATSSAGAPGGGAATVPPAAATTVRPAAPAEHTADASAAAAAPTGRRETVPETPAGICAPRTNFALYRCMQVQCEQSRFYAHPQCVRLRQHDELPS